MKALLPITSLVCAAVSIWASDQNNPERPRDLYSACVAGIKAAVPDAEKPCTEYLSAAGSEDGEKNRIQYVQNWLAKYSEVRAYVQFLSSLTSDPKAAWLVYEPDLSIDLPETSDTNGPFKIQIARSFANRWEETLLSKAEAVYLGPTAMIHDLLSARLCDADLRKEKAAVWGACGNDNIEMTRVVTARAVRYYYDLALLAQKNPHLPSGFTAQALSVEYGAAIKLLPEYHHAQDVFHDVYVADLNLKWSFVCGGLCGVGFTRNKVVVLDQQGNILAMYLDSPVNNTFRVS